MICLIEMELRKSAIFGKRREEGSSLPRASITLLLFFPAHFFFSGYSGPELTTVSYFATVTHSITQQ